MSKKRKKQSKRTRKLKRKWEKSELGRPEKKVKKVGERISYKQAGGKRVSGTIVAVRKESYIVKRKNKFYEVNRRSIFYKIGHALGRTSAKLKGVAISYREGRKTEEMAAKAYALKKRRQILSKYKPRKPRKPRRK